MPPSLSAYGANKSTADNVYTLKACKIKHNRYVLLVDMSDTVSRKKCLEILKDHLDEDEW